MAMEELLRRMEALERRTLRVERQLRRWRLAALCGVAAAMTAVPLTAMAQRRQSRGATFRAPFTVVEERGRPLLRVDTERTTTKVGPPGVAGSGVMRATGPHLKLFTPGGGPGLDLSAEATHAEYPGAHYQWDEAGGQVRVHGEGGKRVAELRAERDSAELKFYTAAGRRPVSLQGTTGGGSLLLYNTQDDGYVDLRSSMPAAATWR